ncbi:MAG: hypothetical protein JW900_07015, partial [Anaerolineae bacterium]|nr:hypothetical protein [Anaerolineae bacterium]
MINCRRTRAQCALLVLVAIVSLGSCTAEDTPSYTPPTLEPLHTAAGGVSPTPLPSPSPQPPPT